MQKINVVKQGFQEAHKRFVIVSLPLSFFALITVGMLVLGYFLPITLILTIPFIIIPSFFSVAAINTVASNKNAHEGIGFFIMFKNYYSQIFRGGYKVIPGFLKALAAFLISSIIMSAILTFAVLQKDPGYIQLVHDMKNVTDANILSEALDNFLSTSQTFKNITIIVNCVSSFFAFYIFMHHFAVNSVKYNYNFIAKLPLPMQDLNLISKKVTRENRKEFYKDYYKAFWFLGLILIAGYTAGVLISYFFINNIDMVQITIVGLFGSFVALLFFVPYFLNASLFIILKFKQRYIHTLIDLSKKSLQEMKKAKAITEDKEKEVLQILESQNEENDDKDSDENK